MHGRAHRGVHRQLCGRMTGAGCAVQEEHGRVHVALGELGVLDGHAELGGDGSERDARGRCLPGLATCPLARLDVPPASDEA